MEGLCQSLEWKVRPEVLSARLQAEFPSAGAVSEALKAEYYFRQFNEAEEEEKDLPPEPATIHLNDGLVLDYSSSVDSRYLLNRLFVRSRETYPEAEAGFYAEQIKQALTDIRSVNPFISEFILKTLDCLKIGRNPDLEGSFNATNSNGPGMVNIVNIHSYESTESYMDCLIHEGIHHLINLGERYKSRLVRPDFWEIPGTEERNLFSPWSGNMIDVYSMLHAVYVWYGLYNFWAECIGGRAAEFPAAATMLIRAAGGFIWHDSLIKQLPGHVMTHICPDTLDDIRYMQNSVCQRHAGILSVIENQIFPRGGSLS